MLFSLDKRHPAGSVLIFTLGVLLLLGLMGMAIMTTTNSELKTTAQTRLGREAFSRADSMATIALQLARTIIVAETAGDFNTIIDNSKSGTATSPPGPVYSVEVDPSIANEMSFYQLGRVSSTDDIRERYLRATEADTSIDPTVTLLLDGNIIGTAHVATTTIIPAGGPQDGTLLFTYIVVSADGRVPRSVGAANVGNYFNEHETETTRSIVSSIYRQVRVTSQ